MRRESSMNELDVLLMPLQDLIDEFHCAHYDDQMTKNLAMAFKRSDFRRKFKREYGFHFAEDREAVKRAARMVGYEARFDPEWPVVVCSLRRLKNQRREDDREKETKQVNT